MKDTQKEEWAKCMATRLRAMCAFVRRAQGRSPQPEWMQELALDTAEQMDGPDGKDCEEGEEEDQQEEEEEEEDCEVSEDGMDCHGDEEPIDDDEANKEQVLKRPASVCSIRLVVKHRPAAASSVESAREPAHPGETAAYVYGWDAELLKAYRVPTSTSSRNPPKEWAANINVDEKEPLSSPKAVFADGDEHDIAELTVQG